MKNKDSNFKPHIISVTVENRFGVLSRIAGLFSARGYNIDSLSVGETDDPSVSRMTIVVKGDDKILEQIYKQLNNYNIRYIPLKYGGVFYTEDKKYFVKSWEIKKANNKASITAMYRGDEKGLKIFVGWLNIKLPKKNKKRLDNI